MSCRVAIEGGVNCARCAAGDAPVELPTRSLTGFLRSVPKPTQKLALVLAFAPWCFSNSVNRTLYEITAGVEYLAPACCVLAALLSTPALLEVHRLPPGIRSKLPWLDIAIIVLSALQIARGFWLK